MSKGSSKEGNSKKRKIQYIALGILSFLLLIAVMLLIAVRLFVVKNVVVEGNTLYDSATIESAVLNDSYSWNSLYVYLKYRFQDTEEIPFVDTMEISLSNPHTLNISVYEKGIMGYVYISSIGENAYFDKDGIVVETSSRIIENTPKIEGISCSEVVLYEKLPIDSSILRGLLVLTQSLKRNDLVPDSIMYGVTNAPVITYGNIRISIGSTDELTQKVERISKILPSLEGMRGTLHLENWTEDTTNIVFDKE